MVEKTGILIVDDDAILRRTLSDILQVKGYSTLDVSTGKAALETMAEEKPAVALIDIKLEDISGLDVMRGIKERYPETECILVTGHASRASAIEAINLGVYSYFLKPYNLDQLLLTIQRAIEKRKTEDALRESEEKHRNLFETMVQGVVYQAGDGKILSVNAAAEKILGLTMDQMRGAASMDPRWRSIHEDGSDFPGDEHPSMVALKTGRKVANTIMGVFNPLKMDYSWININAIPHFRKDEKKPHQVYTTFEDITERKRGEEALRTERDKLKGVLDGVGEGMYIADKTFTIEYQNEIFETLFPGGVGAKCHATYMASDAPCESCKLHESIASGEVRRQETVFTGGTDYDITFSPFTDMNGDVKAIVLARDISEKKILQAEAVRAGQLASLGELAAGVAHEINNPMNGIISYAELLKDDCDEKGEDSDIPVRIIKEGERVAAIVKNLLSFAREQSAGPAPVHPREILSDALGLVESRIRLEGIRLTTDFPPDLPAIIARAHEIQQVFLNLISNARYALTRKFPTRHEGKTLDIEGETTSIGGRKYVRIIFRDAGPGIPETIVDKIINPFFSTKPSGQGTGLGLSISHGIIQAHGGNLRFESVEGEYTKVIVELPVVGE